MCSRVHHAIPTSPSAPRSRRADCAVRVAAASFPLLQARQAAGNVSHHIDNPSSASREPSQTRGRALTASSRTKSPRSQTPAVFAAASSNSSPDRTVGTLERKPSGSYAHNRNTSIVHGIQHSRNTSFVNSPATSPLSPQAIAAAGATIDGAVMSQESIAEAFAANGTHPGASIANGAVHAVTASDGGVPQRKPERAPSARSSRRGHNQQRSQSRHPQNAHELKTVGEYALHHLFNSFIGQAELKIAQCITDRGQPEARVEFVCGPGVDTKFDQLIAALGHIARPAPKPLIDSIMLWRKAKSEDASKQRSQLQNVR
jgi:hypothetical protein